MDLRLLITRARSAPEGGRMAVRSSWEISRSELVTLVGPKPQRRLAGGEVDADAGLACGVVAGEG